MRKAISVTLDANNLLWLRGQAAGTGRGSVSEVLDRIVREARLGGRAEPAAIRSVVGTIDLPEDDSALERADESIQTLFIGSLHRPIQVRERRTRMTARRRRRG